MAQFPCQQRDLHRGHAMNDQRWTVTVEEDSNTGDLILPLPEDMLSQVGWQVGDTLQWHDNQDGTWSLTKKSA
jgi:hypothetical protein